MFAGPCDDAVVNSNQVKNLSKIFVKALKFGQVVEQIASKALFLTYLSGVKKSTSHGGRKQKAQRRKSHCSFKIWNRN